MAGLQFMAFLRNARDNIFHSRGGRLCHQHGQLLHARLLREGWVKIWRVEGIMGKGETHTSRVVEFSIPTKGCNESARKETIGLKKAKTLWFQQAWGAGGYKALGTNARRKNSAGRLAVTERNCIKGTMAKQPFVEERWKKNKIYWKRPTEAEVIKHSLNIHLYLQFWRTRGWWVDLSKYF